MAAGTSGLYTAQVRLSTDLVRVTVNNTLDIVTLYCTVLYCTVLYSTAPDVGVEGGWLPGRVRRGVQQYPRVWL